MARLLENQAAQLLKESTSMQAGQVEGFASVAFPIVRRVFGGLLANDLVSVQPMSLPSGLIFFMDFTFATNTAYDQNASGASLYGGNTVGHQLTGGVDLDGPGAIGAGLASEQGFYNLNNGYSSPTGSITLAASDLSIIASGTVQGARSNLTVTLSNGEKTTLNKLVKFDPELSGTNVAVYKVAGNTLGTADATAGLESANLWGQLNMQNLVAISSDLGSLISTPAGSDTGTSTRLVRRLTQVVPTLAADVGKSLAGHDPGSADLEFLFVVQDVTGTFVAAGASAHGGSNELFQKIVPAKTPRLSFPIEDNFSGTPTAGTNNALGAVVGTDAWGLEGDGNIPEIDIKVDSVSVTAVTKKLKAKWTPELGQDLNAYHNLDAEVELTSILSEQIALEIDREIIEDLVIGATTKEYWSRSPGLFVDRATGAEIGA